MKYAPNFKDIKDFIQSNDEAFKTFLYNETRILTVKIIRHYHSVRIDSFFNRKHIKNLHKTEHELYKDCTEGKYRHISLLSDANYYWLNETYNMYVKLTEVMSNENIEGYSISETEFITFEYLVSYMNRFLTLNKKPDEEKNQIGFQHIE